MRKLTIAALLAGQILAAAPAGAADFAESRQQQAGAFAGIRLRVPLDGAAHQRSIRVGLTLAPTMHSRTAGGETQMRIGEGLELGIADRGPVHLSIGGTPVSRVAQGRTGPDGQRLGVSTLGWIAIGVGTFVVVGAVAGYLWFEDAIDCDPGDECS